jgi:hypothetical protein
VWNLNHSLTKICIEQTVIGLLSNELEEAIIVTPLDLDSAMDKLAVKYSNLPISTFECPLIESN